MSIADLWADLIQRTRDDPDAFNRAIQRPDLWAKQREIGDSVVKYRITCAYTGNAIGKDYLVGTLVPWWLVTRPKALVIVTGPSQTLLGSVTWKEIRQAVTGSDLLQTLGPRLSEGVKASPQTLRFTALDPAQQALGYSTTSVERASGQHARSLLVIGEEASGIPDEIYDAIDSLKYTRLLLIGNPLRAEGRFVELIRQAGEDHKNGVPPNLAVNAIRIASTESPDAEKDESDYGLADKTWLLDCARRYGKDSLWYRAHVLAQIPDSSSDTLIPPAWLDYASSIERPGLPANHPVHRTRRIACDLGEGVGRDATAIVVRDDLGVREVVAGNALGLSEAASEIQRLSIKWAVEHSRISYDRLGIGRDLRNHLARHGITTAVPYAGSGRPQDPSSFTNLRSEAAWKLRRRLNPDWVTDPAFPLASKQSPFSIPPGEWWLSMREDLEALTYDLVGNKTRLIPKEDLCIKLGRSPDRGDALMQSFAFD